MRFTAIELQNIERTMGKLKTVASTMWASDSNDAVNARYIDYIISEMRVCATLAGSDDRDRRIAAYDRLDSLITK